MSSKWRLCNSVAIIVVICALGLCHSQETGFTVTKMIEMARFSDPSEALSGSAAKTSPDHKSILVVTSEGDIASNTIISTMWLFKTKQINEYVTSETDSPRPAPEAVARIASIPREEAASITDVRWAADSRFVYFLGRNAQSGRRLYKVDVKAKETLAVSLPGQNVEHFDVAGQVVVYCSSPPKQFPPAPATFVNQAPQVATGRTLSSVLFHQEPISGAPCDLWQITGANARPVRILIRHALRPDSAPYGLVFSLSPNGRYFLVSTPVYSVPREWEIYTPAAIYSGFPIKHDDPSETSPTNTFRLRKYQLMDLANNRIVPLPFGPLGNSLGYWDLNRVAWTENSEHVFVTNVFLSFEGESQEGHQRIQTPCKVAYVSIRLGVMQCVVPGDSNVERVRGVTAASLLQDVTVSDRGSELRVLFNDFQGATRADLYRDVNGQWTFTNSLRNSADASQDAADATIKQPKPRPAQTQLVIKQDLNTPPSLWGVDSMSGRSKEVWNPNRWLTKKLLGNVSIYHWTGPDGYQWTGGLVLPPDYVAGRRYPLVIQTHGFEEEQFMSAGEFTTAMAARPLSSSEMIVLQIRDRRDHHDGLQEALDQIVGYQSAIASLSTAGLIDAHRVGIVGFSRTCWHVETALTELPHLFAAAVVADGEDFGYMQYMLFAPESTYIQKGAMGVVGAPPFGEGLNAWTRNVSIFHLDRVLTPLRIEALGPASLLQEWELYSSLHLQNKPVDLIYLPDGEHVLIKPRERLVSEQGTVDWFRFWLQDDEGLDPTKREQYSRWRELKSGSMQNLNALGHSR